MISASGSTVIGFSLTGDYFSGCGTMIELGLDGEATGLSAIIVSDPAGTGLPFEYFDGKRGVAVILLLLWHKCKRRVISVPRVVQQTV